MKKENTYYLVVNQGQLDCGSFWNETRLYISFEKAKEDFENCVKQAKEDFNGLETVEDKSDSYFNIYEDGYFCYNNCTVELRRLNIED